MIKLKKLNSLTIIQPKKSSFINLSKNKLKKDKKVRFNTVFSYDECKEYVVNNIKNNI